MATVLTNDENYKNIANAIREKNQTDMTYKPAEMPDAIRAISGEKYVLPVASEDILGGVKGPEKTDGQVQVQVDNEGNMWVPAAGSEGAIPIATEDTLGGVKGPVKTEEETEQVHISEDGQMWVKPSGSGEGVGYILPAASVDTLGGIKLPSQPSDYGEEILMKHGASFNGVQFAVDKTLSPEGEYKDDDTVSVSIPYAATEDSKDGAQPVISLNKSGLVRSAKFGARRFDPKQELDGYLDRAYYPVVYPWKHYADNGYPNAFEPGVGYIQLEKPEGMALGGVTSEFATLTPSAEATATRGIPVAIASNGNMYVPPVGHSIDGLNKAGVVVSNGKKTDADTIPVHNDENGRLWVAPSGEGGGGGSYTLPVATEDTLGGVKGAEKVEGDNVPVHINDQGEMFVNALTSPWPEDVLGKIELTYENVFSNNLITPEFMQQLINGKNQGWFQIQHVADTTKGVTSFQVYKIYQGEWDPNFCSVEFYDVDGAVFEIYYYGVDDSEFSLCDYLSYGGNSTISPLNILILQERSNSIAHHKSQIWRIVKVENSYSWNFKTTLVSSDGKKTMIVDGSKLASTNYAWPDPIPTPVTQVYSYETDIFKDGILTPTGDATKFGAELSETARQYLCTHIESLAPEDQIQVYLSQKAAGVAARFEFSCFPNASAGSTIAGPCSIQFGSPFSVYTSSFDSTYPGKYDGWYFEESGNIKFFLTPISGFSDNPSMTQLSTLMSLNGQTVALSMPETTNTSIANGIYFQYHELNMGSGGGGSSGGGITMEQVKAYVDERLGVIENGAY